MTRRSTKVALFFAFVVLTVTVGLASVRLQHQAASRAQVQVDWFSWGVACVAAFGGLALIGWWALVRDRASSCRRADPSSSEEG